ncbi:hypothetical protein FRC04_006583 [Tulasnella sp. 424]|nr:hypothetical protein FRC04_006583 [Tulasnella sp. 424]
MTILQVTIDLIHGAPRSGHCLQQDCRVDEKGKAILAPQWADEFLGFDVEREELKHHWDQFLSLHAYTLRNCCLLNPLWYGLLGNSELLLSKRTPLHDTSRAIGMLRGCWPPSSERVRPLPATDDKAPELGDIGVFVAGPGKRLSFRKLGNMSQELGGVELELEPIQGFDLVEDDLLRIDIASNSEDYVTEDETQTFGTRSEVAASFEDELRAEDSVSWAQRSEPSISEEFPGGSEHADSEIQMGCSNAVSFCR